MFHNFVMGSRGSSRQVLSSTRCRILGNAVSFKIMHFVFVNNAILLSSHSLPIDKSGFLIWGNTYACKDSSEKESVGSASFASCVGSICVPSGSITVGPVVVCCICLHGVFALI